MNILSCLCSSVVFQNLKPVIKVIVKHLPCGKMKMTDEHEALVRK